MTTSSPNKNFQDNDASELKQFLSDDSLEISPYCRLTREKRERLRQKKRILSRLKSIPILLTVSALVCLISFFGIYKTAKYVHRTINSTKMSAKKASKETSSSANTEEMTTTATTAAAPITLKVSVVGDCTLGKDQGSVYATSLNAFYSTYGKDYFLQNVKDIFSSDDFTIANFEGTLTDSEARAEKAFAFKAPPEFAQILTSGSVEAVNTANNHSHDYGDISHTDTIAALDSENIINFGYDKTQVVDIKGVKVGLVGINEVDNRTGSAEPLKANIQKVKNEGAELIIVIFHWGYELHEAPSENQRMLGHLAIDEGADLVCGHHPHTLQGIEQYKGKNIVYSLGNFCFGGNKNPRDKDTMIFQQTFTVTNGQVADDNVSNIIPCSISSTSSYNDYRPTPAQNSEYERIMQKIQYRSSLIPAA